MKLIIFTTCKPFIGDDAWRQEQAIKSWTLLEGIEKKIIVMGNDEGTREICEKYNLIHEPNIKTLNDVPYLHDMFVIANKYANDHDILLWTNSDMIYFQQMITAIYSFKINYQHEKNYLLVGQRIDWHNPKIIPNLTYSLFFEKINLKNSPTTNVCMLDSSYNECSLHPPSGIDYVLHSKSTFENNMNKDLVIAGTGHDMLMLGMGLQKNFFTCDITSINPVIHQNHGYLNNDNKNILKKNNQKYFSHNYRLLKYIHECKHKTILDNNEIKFIKTE